MEVLLNILGDLALLGSIALLLWGMVLCAMVEFGELQLQPRLPLYDPGHDHTAPRTG